MVNHLADGEEEEEEEQVEVDIGEEDMQPGKKWTLK